MLLHKNKKRMLPPHELLIHMICLFIRINKINQHLFKVCIDPINCLNDEQAAFSNKIFDASFCYIIANHFLSFYLIRFYIIASKLSNFLVSNAYLSYDYLIFLLSYSFYCSTIDKFSFI